MTVIVTLAWSIPAVCGSVDARTVGLLIFGEEAWYRAGGSVLVATDREGGVPAHACDAIPVTVSGVDASMGVVQQSGRLRTAAAPDALISLVPVTPGAHAYLGVAAKSGVLVTPLARDALGSGSTITVSGLDAGENTGVGAARLAELPQPDQSFHIGADVDAALLSEEFDGAILVPTQVSPGAVVDACYVRTAPGVEDSVRAALPAALAGANQNEATVISPLLSKGQFGRDWVQEFETRPTKHLAVASSILLGIIWILVRILRRSQDGLYATLGAGVVERAVIRSTEWLSAAGVGTVLGLLGAAMLNRVSGVPLGLSFHFTVRGAVLGLCVGVVVTLVSTLLPVRSPLGALKNR